MNQTGYIVQVSGPVIDVAFADRHLPAIREALRVEHDGVTLAHSSRTRWRRVSFRAASKVNQRLYFNGLRIGASRFYLYKIRAFVYNINSVAVFPGRE